MLNELINKETKKFCVRNWASFAGIYDGKRPKLSSSILSLNVGVFSKIHVNLSFQAVLEQVLSGVGVKVAVDFSNKHFHYWRASQKDFPTPS